MQSLKNNKVTYALLPHQKKFISSKKDYICMICGRGSGKTYIASILAALKLIKGERVIVFAQSWASLTENLMKEITHRLDEIIPPEANSKLAYKYNRSGQKIELGNGVIYGATYESQDAIRGYTQISSLILDEAALSKPDILEVAGPCLRGLPNGVEPHIYCITTPKAASWFNRFVLDKVEKNPDTIDIIKAKTTDNYFVSKKEYELMLGGFTDPNIIKQELEGELLDELSKQSLGHLIQDWCCERNIVNPKQVVIGIDPSGLGADKTAICIRDDKFIYGFWYADDGKVGNVSNVLYLALKKLGNPKVLCLYIDAGYGRELYEHFSNIYPCIKVGFGSPSKDKTYLNVRAEMYFNMAYKLSYYKFCDNADMDKICKEISVTEFIYNGENKLRLVSKEDIRNILGHSPDTCDSLALTFYEDMEFEDISIEKPIWLGNPED